MMGVNARRGAQHSGMLAGEVEGRPAMLDGTPGDEDAADASGRRPFHDRRAVCIEALVGQVQADIDEFDHAQVP